MDKKKVLGAAYFQEVLEELTGRQFDQVIAHLRNRHDMKFARYPNSRGAARKLVERDDGAKVLSEAINEVKAANDALTQLEAAEALDRLEKLEQQAEE